MVMDRPGGEPERLRRVVEARWADAIILAWTRRHDPRIKYLTEVGFPFATLGRSLSGGTGYPSLDLDFVRAGRNWSFASPRAAIAASRSSARRPSSISRTCSAAATVRACDGPGSRLIPRC